MYSIEQTAIGCTSVSRIFDTLPDGTKCTVLKPDKRFVSGIMKTGTRTETLSEAD